MEDRYFSCAYNKAYGAKCVGHNCRTCKRLDFIGGDGVVRCKCAYDDCGNCTAYVNNDIEMEKKRLKSWCRTCGNACKKETKVSFCKNYVKANSVSEYKYDYCAVCVHNCKRGEWCPNFSVNGGESNG